MVSFNLPYSEIDKYPEMLHTLESSMDALGILSISIANTTMSDVLLK